MTIPAFVAGILATIFAEMFIILITAISFIVVDSRKTHRNTSNSARSDENE